MTGPSERPFLVFDALGFCAALNSLSLTEVFNRLAAQVSLVAGTATVRDARALEIAFVSDTIVVLAPSDVPAAVAVQRLAEYACVLLINGIMTERIAFPLRGTLGFGEIIADVNHTWEISLQRKGAQGEVQVKTCRLTGPDLIGRVVVEAMEWEKSQKWVGASIEPNQLRHLRSSMGTVVDGLVSSHCLLEWEVPTAHGLVRTLALNFVHLRNKNRVDYLLRELRKGEDQAPNLEVRAKYIASRLFAEQVIRDGTYNPT